MPRLKSNVLQAAMLAAMGLATGCATLPGATATPDKAAPKPEKPVFLQADVMGLEAGALDGLLGPAALTRREGAGEFRRYAFLRCELIVILYPDETGASAVRQLEAAAKNSEEGKPDLDDCLAGGPAAKAN
jgi:hypothetical protein